MWCASSYARNGMPPSLPLLICGGAARSVHCSSSSRLADRSDGLPLVRREHLLRALRDHHQSAAGPGNMLPRHAVRAPENAVAAAQVVLAVRRGHERTDRVLGLARSAAGERVTVPRRARVGRHHHGRAAPDPVPALHEDQPASFGPTFRCAQHTPRAPAVLRLGDASSARRAQSTRRASTRRGAGGPSDPATRC